MKKYIRTKKLSENIPKYRKKRSKNKKSYFILYKLNLQHYPLSFLNDGKWHVWKRYITKTRRDEAFKALQKHKKRYNYIFKIGEIDNIIII